MNGFEVEACLPCPQLSTNIPSPPSQRECVHSTFLKILFMNFEKLEDVESRDSHVACSSVNNERPGILMLWKSRAVSLEVPLT